MAGAASGTSQITRIAKRSSGARRRSIGENPISCPWRKTSAVPEVENLLCRRWRRGSHPRRRPRRYWQRCATSTAQWKNIVIGRQRIRGSTRSCRGRSGIGKTPRSTPNISMCCILLKSPCREFLRKSATGHGGCRRGIMRFAKKPKPRPKPLLGGLSAAAICAAESGELTPPPGRLDAGRRRLQPLSATCATIWCRSRSQPATCATGRS